jgi:hypothetical protein
MFVGGSLEEIAALGNRDGSGVTVKRQNAKNYPQITQIAQIKA